MVKTTSQLFFAMSELQNCLDKRNEFSHTQLGYMPVSLSEPVLPYKQSQLELGERLRKQCMVTLHAPLYIKNRVPLGFESVKPAKKVRLYSWFYH